MEQSNKRDAERYLVVTKMTPPLTVWATSFANVLKELKESRKAGDTEVLDDDVISITKLDF